MKHITFFIFIFVIFSTMLFAQQITVMTEDFPPLNYVVNGKADGPAVKIVEEIKTIVNCESEIKVYPWKRGYNFLETKPNHCLFSTTRNEKREKLFKWVGPLAIKQKVFLAKKGSKFKINSLEDAKNYVVGGQLGGSAEDFLRKHNFPKLELGMQPEVNFKKLAGGRFDLWFTSKATPYTLAKKLNYNLDDYEVVYVESSGYLYIAFNKETSDKIITQWQAAYDQLLQNGTIEKIYKEFGYEANCPPKK